MSPISFSFLFNTLSTGTIYTVVGRVSKKKQACVYGFIQLKHLFSLENRELPGMVSALPVSRFRLGGLSALPSGSFPHTRVFLGESHETAPFCRETWGTT